jgi:hypothetical protein
MKITNSLFGTSQTVLDDKFEFNIGDLICYSAFEGQEAWPTELGIIVRKSESQYFRKVYIVYWIREERTTATLGNYIKLISDDKKED